MAIRASPFPSAEAFFPPRISLPTLKTAAATCKGCDLFKTGTQTVFGEGPRSAVVMFVGEQPGDQEDKQGKPFVGPAGRLLDETLEKVGIDRSQTYVTNAVKHFKWEPRGKRRIHAKPNSRVVEACIPWLKAEVELVQPLILVPMGATAAQDVIGKDFKVSQKRGQPIKDSPWAPTIIATYHPSSIWRAPDPAEREAAMRRFEEDMQAVARELAREMQRREKRPPRFTGMVVERVPEHYHAPMPERYQPSVGGA